MKPSNGQGYYRNVYLKSEHWQNLRLEKLAQSDATCVICKKRSLSNDVHHLQYRKLRDVKLTDLVVLCRECHEAAHKSLDRMKEIEANETCYPHDWWEEFLEFWKPGERQLRELGCFIADMRKSGKLPKRAVRLRKNRDIAKLEPSDFDYITLKVPATDMNVARALSKLANEKVADWLTRNMADKILEESMKANGATFAKGNTPPSRS